MRTKKGFTLIEILVVIGIIALLAAILFPVLSRARESARAKVCMSNLNQLGMAFAMYRQDSDRKFPLAGKWQEWAQGGNWVLQECPPSSPTCGSSLVGSAPDFKPTGSVAIVEDGAIYPYARSSGIYVCPSSEYGREKHLSYSMNCALAGMSDVRLREPSETILLVDEGNSLNDGYFFASTPTSIADWPSTLTKVHSGGGNLLFTDGHVKFYPFASFPLDDSVKGKEDKAKIIGDPRFHDLRFGPNGSSTFNTLVGYDSCGAPLS